MDPITDADAIAKSGAEPESFAAIFERHFDTVYAYLARRMGPDAGGDLTAQTFLAAFESRRRYDLSRSDARPWLLGIATNLAHRHWRTERTRLAATARVGRGDVADSEDDAAVNRVDAGAAAAAVAEAVAELDPRSRDVLLLIAWADLSYAEVAEALDIPVGTVRSRLSRARHQLRRRLAASACFPDLTYPLEPGG